MVAVFHWARRRSVGLIIFDEFDEPVKIGSGVCVSIAGRFFIATAGHNLTDSNGNAEVFKYVLLTERPEDRAVRILSRGHAGGGPRDPVDLGWLEITKGAAEELDRVFLTLDDLDLAWDATPGKTIHVYGSVGDPTQSTHNGKPQIGVQAVGYTTCTRDHASLKAEYRADAGRDIILEYPSMSNLHSPTGWWRTTPPAQGLSGSGLWAVNAREGSLWNPSDVKLVGLQHEWGHGDGWLRGIHIRLWLRLIASRLPELRELSDAHSAASSGAKDPFEQPMSLADVGCRAEGTFDRVDPVG